MTGFYLEPAADRRLDEIYTYTRDAWGRDQADRYVLGLFDHFGAIAARRILWRSIPASFGFEGYFCRYERHFIYWKPRADDIAIVAILHERMDQIERLNEDLTRP